MQIAMVAIPLFYFYALVYINFTYVVIVGSRHNDDFEDEDNNDDPPPPGWLDFLQSELVAR